jgi:ABC-type oligopeptide transport system ATPase subunit
VTGVQTCALPISADAVQKQLLDGQDPKKLKEYLDQYVVGQIQAKMTLAVAIVNHYKRISNQDKDIEINKANILMVGPSGCGKTMLAKTIAKYLGPGFTVEASRGHIRDLPKRAPKGVKQPVPGVDLDNDFEPTYEVSDDRKAQVTALKLTSIPDEKLPGKATLAAEDIRFGRTVEKLQRIIVSELYKIAFVHLYIQGYRDESLTNFELSLTTPSIIYDQERVMLLKEKMDLAQSMMDSQLISSDWIYDNIFHLSQDQYEEMRDLVLQDAKRKFRVSQIENEGNDPLETGETYGTPHDIATSYGKGRVYDRPGSVPDGYNRDQPEMGRPEEKGSNIDTTNDPLGMDRLGRKAMKTDDQQGYGRDNTSPFALENTKKEFVKHKKILDSLGPKKMIFESERKANSLLDESQIRE